MMPWYFWIFVVLLPIMAVGLPAFLAWLRSGDKDDNLD